MVNKEYHEMTEIEKLESGKFLLVRTSAHYLRTFTTLAAVMGILYVLISRYNLTFDSQEQKRKVIDNSEAGHPITESETDRFDAHLRDETRHVNFQEKAYLQELNEDRKARTRIMQDLDEIKKILKNE